KRKLIPAFYNLFIDGWMPENFVIYGLGRTELSDKDYQEHLYQGLKDFSRNGTPKKADWDKFKGSLHYQTSNINDQASYDQLLKTIKHYEQQRGERANRLFYLSITPNFIETLSLNLSKSGLVAIKE